MSDYKKILAQNIKELMGKMSINELSRKVDIPQPTLSRYLLCQREISFENLVKLANFFNEDIDVLIGRKDY